MPHTLPPEGSGQGEATRWVHISLDTHVENTELSDTRKMRCLHVGFWQQGPCQPRGVLRGSLSGGKAGRGLQQGLSLPDPRGLESKLTRDVLPRGEPSAVWPTEVTGAVRVRPPPWLWAFPQGRPAPAAALESEGGQGGPATNQNHVPRSLRMLRTDTEGQGPGRAHEDGRHARGRER